MADDRHFAWFKSAKDLTPRILMSDAGKPPALSAAEKAGLLFGPVKLTADHCGLTLARLAQLYPAPAAREES